MNDDEKKRDRSLLGLASDNDSNSALESVTETAIDDDTGCCRNFVSHPKVQQITLVYFRQPLYVRVFGTAILLVIAIDGAILFFAIVGGFSYVDETTQGLILEITIQVINACFTILCAVELPFRLRSAYYWTLLSFATEEQLLVIHLPPWSIRRWKLFGFLTYTKIVQIGCQAVVQYFCFYYFFVYTYEDRPSGLFFLFVALSLSLGCFIGVTEAWLNSSYESPDQGIVSESTLIAAELSTLT